jgi:NAD(P)-dependent dehydrogenase (short-subunit alcohol dehydrogenase family)
VTGRLRTLIVGGSRGVGRATALELAGRGHDVAIAYVAGAESAAKVVAELPAEARGFALQGDIATDGPRLVAEAVEALGGLDAVVVTAVPVITGPLSKARSADIARCFDVVNHGFREVALAAQPHLAATGGSIVAVSSLGSQRYAGYYGAIGPAKAALEATVRYLAVEFGSVGVRVNAVSPCLLDDPQHFAGAPEVMRFVEATARRTPLNQRLADPSDVARTIAALLGPDFHCVTGQVIVIDGAYSLQA